MLTAISSQTRRMAQWRGNYLNWGISHRAGYVGSAGGAENFIGRRRDYAKTGHGGNEELRRSEPGNMGFSILERISPDLEQSPIAALETSWKQGLHTREFRPQPQLTFKSFRYERPPLCRAAWPNCPRSHQLCGINAARWRNRDVSWI